MLPVIIAATEDKSWRVRLALSKNFAELSESFGKEITDMSLIQIYTTLLKDVECEVKIACINSLKNFIK
jgi:serine/threonine-protein phosphatase 2A regulatory subunit A